MCIILSVCVNVQQTIAGLCQYCLNIAALVPGRIPEDNHWKEVAAGRNIPSVLVAEQTPELEPQVVGQMQEPGQDTAIAVDTPGERVLAHRMLKEQLVLGRDTAVATMGNRKALEHRDRPHFGSWREPAHPLPTSHPMEQVGKLPTEAPMPRH